MVATFGERISAVILSRALAAMGSFSSPLLPEDAGILHPRTVEPVKKAGIDIAVLKMYASGVGARPGILSGITENLSSSGINIKLQNALQPFPTLM
ncbi:MAG: hypothetical protein M0T82_07215 [Desulfobacteraceae bacterium]|nr:hypothetical protein [Desulfobacteraceae bacterium]